MYVNSADERPDGERGSYPLASGRVFSSVDSMTSEHNIDDAVRIMKEEFAAIRRQLDLAHDNQERVKQQLDEQERRLNHLAQSLQTSMTTILDIQLQSR
jgi:hypothetical protein